MTAGQLKQANIDILNRLVTIGNEIKRKFDRWADDFANPVIKWANERIASEAGALEEIDQSGTSVYGAKKLPELMQPLSYLLQTNATRRKKLSGYRFEISKLIEQFNQNAILIKLQTEEGETPETEAEKEARVKEEAARQANTQTNTILIIGLVLAAFLYLRKRFRK